MPTSRALRGVGAALALVLLDASAAGCAAVPAPVRPAPVSSSTSPVPVPADGALLRAFGFTNGPLDSFSLPRTSVLRTAVDQTDDVALVLSAPTAADVAAYLRRTLPAAGYELTAVNAAGDTLTFTGRGWSGSVTGTASTTAVLLRPL